MVNKKAYLKTLEAVIAIILFLSFISAALLLNKPPEKQEKPQDIELLQDYIFNKLETEPELRQCLIDNNTICISGVINSSLHTQKLDYDFEICNLDPDQCIYNIVLNETKTIYADSLIIQEGNNSAIIRLYIWKKLE
tara:strand:- start:578 stop:988 length:411 start_codon:yes stop_codon:yes gene_type:complete